MEENDIKKDPMALMLGMVIDSTMETTHKLIEIVNKYEAAGIDVIPINELKECLSAGHKKSLSEDGFLNKVLNS